MNAHKTFSNVGVDNTCLLDVTDKFIQCQPKVLGDLVGLMLGYDMEGMIQWAREYKKMYGDLFISVEHLLLVSYKVIY